MFVSMCKLHMDTNIRNAQVRSIMCHALCKLRVCKCTCTSSFFFLWSLLMSPATLKIRDETNFIGPGNSFCWVYPTYTQFPCTQDGHLIFETHGQQPASSACI